MVMDGKSMVISPVVGLTIVPALAAWIERRARAIKAAWICRMSRLRLKNSFFMGRFRFGGFLLLRDGHAWCDAGVSPTPWYCLCVEPRRKFLTGGRREVSRHR